jgi:hypothetical protein
MRTIQISIGEIIEAIYDELLEAYGDKELALIAAEALTAELLDEAGTSAKPIHDVHAPVANRHVDRIAAA